MLLFLSQSIKHFETSDYYRRYTTFYGIVMIAHIGLIWLFDFISMATVYSGHRMRFFGWLGIVNVTKALGLDIDNGK